jgi:RNA polymerase-binding transcription factor DksA
MADQAPTAPNDQVKRLQEEQQRIVADLQGLREYLATGIGRVAEGSADSVDTAADIYEREKTLAIIQTLTEKLAAIERALQATERGVYGICEVCGQAIHPDRLEVMPHTRTCIKCQARLERLKPGRYSATPSLEDEDF